MRSFTVEFIPLQSSVFDRGTSVITHTTSFYSTPINAFNLYPQRSNSAGSRSFTVERDTMGRHRRERSSIRIFKDTKGRLDQVLETIAPSMGQLHQMDRLLDWIERRLLEPHQGETEHDEGNEETGRLESGEERGRVDLPLGGDPMPVQDDLKTLVLAIVEEALQSKGFASTAVEKTIVTGADGKTVDRRPEGQDGARSPSKDLSTHSRGRKPRADVQDRVNRAIDSIILFNSHPDRLHDHRWEITINALKSLGCAQSAVYRVLLSRQTEIDSHHQLLGIAHGHNARHRRQALITDFIFL
jgi:hypothetical protein